MGKTEKNPARKTVTVILAGVALAVAVSLLLLLGCAAAISAGLLGLDQAETLTLIACGAGGFPGGLLAVRKVGRRALPVGVGTGGLFFLCLMAAGLLLVESAAPGLSQLPLLCVCLGTGALAGLAGKKRKKRRT